MQIRLVGVGPVSLEELEACYSAYLNAGAPKPVLEGSPQQQREILEHVGSRGDSPMKSLVTQLLDA